MRGELCRSPMTRGSCLSSLISASTRSGCSNQRRRGELARVDPRDGHLACGHDVAGVGVTVKDEDQQRDAVPDGRRAPEIDANQGFLNQALPLWEPVDRPFNRRDDVSSAEIVWVILLKPTHALQCVD